MKKRGLIPVLVLLLVCGTAYSLPSIMGFRGVNRVVDARTIGTNHMAFSLIARYWSSANDFDNLVYRPMGSASDTVLSVQDHERLSQGYFALDYGLTSFMELAARISYVGTYYEYDLTPPRNQTIGQWDGAHGMGDVMLGYKAGFTPTPSSEVLWLGLDNWFAFAPTSNETVECEEYDGNYYAGTPLYSMRTPSLSTGHTSYGFDGLISADMASVWPGTPLRMHVNVGYAHYKQTPSMMDYRLQFDSTGQASLTDTVHVSSVVEDNTIDFGVALEFPTKFAVLYTEYTLKSYMDRDNYSTVAYFTPGIRVFSGGGVIMDFCFNMGLTDFSSEYFDYGHRLYQQGSVTQEERDARAPLPAGGTQDWGVSGSIAFSSDLLVEEPMPTTGQVSGIVTETVNNDPIPATVSFPGLSVAAVMSDSVTGFYSAELPAGSVPISVNAEGYKSASSTVVLEAGADVVVDFALEPAAGLGQVAGTVTEFENSDPLQATLSVQVDDTTYTFQSTADGVFQFDIPEGTWTVKAEAEGYRPSSDVVVVSPDETAIVDFVLKPALQEGQVLSFDNIYFDSGSATIKPESYYVLDNMVEILNANPNASVQIAGHTDSDGSSSYNQTLSEQRAASVFNYLVQRGVPASMLSTMGFGESQPVVPNTSAQNKAMN
ncbi:MAG: OmpA family protein, partial [Candidatus Aegiribacteria sp.]|nr:OmpA family protein [Candidatus Aegiribacteria sp.]MBD3294248.1 OmpA family protein [Candidatus Fermentibacteria bacterium]